MSAITPYYEQALDDLEQALKAYAHQHPNQSQRLNLDDAQEKDPSVERLLTGFAYLVAQLREKIDDDVPELSRTLLNALAPELLQAVPSQIMMCCRSDLSHLRKTILLKKSKHFLMANFNFSTKRQLALNPLAIKKTAWQLESGAATFDMVFDVLNDVDLNTLNLSDLPVYLEGKFSHVYCIYRHLLDDVDRIELFALSGGKQTSIASQLLVLSEQRIRAEQLVEGAAINDCKQFFLNPRQFMFLYCRGLDQVNWPGACVQFSIRLHLKTAHDLSEKFNQVKLLLHVVPAENRYLLSAEPFRLTHQVIDYPLNLDFQQAQRLLSIHSVRGNQQYFSYQLEPERLKPSYELVDRSHAQGAPHYFLRFSEASLKNDHEIISCEAWVCEGSLVRQNFTKNTRPAHLSCQNDLGEQLLSFENLHRPTAYYPRPEKNHFSWQFLDYFNTQLSSFFSLSRIKSFLLQTAWIDISDKVNALKDVHVKEALILRKNILYDEIEISLYWEERVFLSLDEMYCWGDMLHHLFIKKSSVNQRVITQVICQPSEHIFCWEQSSNMRFIA